MAEGADYGVIKADDDPRDKAEIISVSHVDIRSNVIEIDKETLSVGWVIPRSG